MNLKCFFHPFTVYNKNAKIEQVLKTSHIVVIFLISGLLAVTVILIPLAVLVFFILSYVFREKMRASSLKSELTSESKKTIEVELEYLAKSLFLSSKEDDNICQLQYLIQQVFPKEQDAEMTWIEFDKFKLSVACREGGEGYRALIVINDSIPEQHQEFYIVSLKNALEKANAQRIIFKIKKFDMEKISITRNGIEIEYKTFS